MESLSAPCSPGQRSATYIQPSFVHHECCFKTTGLLTDSQVGV